MQICERCGIRIRGAKRCCPLCGAILQEQNTLQPNDGTLRHGDVTLQHVDEEPNLYPAIRTKVSKYYLLRISALVSILIEIILITTGILLEDFAAWNLILMVATLLIWLDIAIAFYTRKNIMLFVSLQTYFGMAATLYLDRITGNHGWASVWMLPIVFPALAAATIGIGKGMKMLLQDYIVFLELDLLLSILVQGLLIRFGMNPFRLPAILSMALLISMGATALIFWTREIKGAAEKLFHM